MQPVVTLCSPALIYCFTVTPSGCDIIHVQPYQPVTKDRRENLWIQSILLLCHAYILKQKGLFTNYVRQKLGCPDPPAQLPNPFCRVNSFSIITTTISLNEYFFEVYTIFDHHYQYVIMSLIKKIYS